MTWTLSPKEGLHCILGVAVTDAGLGLEGGVLDLRGPPWSEQPRPGISQSHGYRVPGPSRNSPCAGIPRAPRFTACPASESDTCGARVRSGTGRWKIPLRERRDVSTRRLVSRVSESVPGWL